MIKTFLFDLGNVLLFFSHEKMCRQLGMLCDRSAEEIRELIFASDAHLRYERGELSTDDFHNWFQTETGTQVSLADLCIAAGDIFVPNASMFPILEELKHRGHRLVLLSNTQEAHIDFIRQQYDVLDRFDHLILSYEVGAVKPEDAIYRAALKQIDCAPAECFYADDISDYVERGQSFGLLAGVFTDTRSFVEQVGQHGTDLSDLI